MSTFAVRFQYVRAITGDPLRASALAQVLEHPGLAALTRICARWRDRKRRYAVRTFARSFDRLNDPATEALYLDSGPGVLTALGDFATGARTDAGAILHATLAIPLTDRTTHLAAFVELAEQLEASTATISLAPSMREATKQLEAGGPRTPLAEWVPDE